MPTTEPRKSSGGNNIKRYALLVIVIVAAAAALDRMSAAAQKVGRNGGQIGRQIGGQDGGQDGGKQEEYGKTARDDCSYLQNPDTFRRAMATHRDLVSRSTEMISQSLISAVDEQTEISLVPPQEIPRKQRFCRPSSSAVADHFGPFRTVAAPPSAPPPHPRRRA